MRKAWKDFIEESPHDYKFLHLEELSEFGLENFINDLTAVNGGEYLNEPMNQSLAYNQIKNYEDISKKKNNCIKFTFIGIIHRPRRYRT